MTLKLNELRIGNWIQFQNEEPQQLTAYTLASLCQNPVALEFYKPVEIVPEWLIKIGFNDSNGSYAKEDEKLEFIFDWDSTTGLYIYKIGFDWPMADLDYIKHIHQIQNLFFSLFNQEL